jgi:hypothetical protein
MWFGISGNEFGKSAESSALFTLDNSVGVERCAKRFGRRSACSGLFR